MRSAKIEDDAGSTSKGKSRVEGVSKVWGRVWVRFRVWLKVWDTLWFRV